MAVLSFDNGLVSYTVNGVENAVKFNPSDPNFADRMYTTFEALEKKQTARDGDIQQAKTAADMLKVIRKYDEEMREAIDSLFSEGACAAVFGDMSTYAMAGGLPVWANFMLSVIAECDGAFAREQKQVNPKIQKYIKKYQQAQKK